MQYHSSQPKNLENFQSRQENFLEDIEEGVSLTFQTKISSNRLIIEKQKLQRKLLNEKLLVTIGKLDIEANQIH